MSNLGIGSLGVLALLVVLWLRMPIGVALALVGACGYAAIDGWRKALTVLASVPFELANAYSLSVVPLFILMGAVASRGNMAKEMFDACNGLFSGIRGALAIALMVAISVAWYISVVYLFTTGFMASAYGRLRHWIDRTAGVLLVWFGTKLALDRA